MPVVCCTLAPTAAATPRCAANLLFAALRRPQRNACTSIVKQYGARRALAIIREK